MISYNKTWLANLRLQKEVKKDLLEGNISNTEFAAITERYPVGFYSPNIFVRIGLFILTCIIILSGLGLLSLLASSEIAETGGWLFFMGLVVYALLEALVNSNYHYRSGVDDALLFLSGWSFVIAFSIWLHNDSAFFILLSAIVFVLYLFFTLRFADMLAAVICCAAFFSLVFYSWIRIGSIGLSTVQFVIMLVAAGMYWLIYIYKNEKAFTNYKNCITIAEVLSLLILYAAGNYYIIQTLSDELHGQAKAISLGALFWTWTIALPFVYVWFSIRKKDVILLRVGLLLIVAAAVTFRTYYHILPLDVSLTIVGAIILGVVYMVMKYLKEPRHGFTLAEAGEANLMDDLRIESLAVAQTFSHAPSAPASDGTKFGGGDFGGGGSSDNF